jgi:hypothetical protein
VNHLDRPLALQSASDTLKHALDAIPPRHRLSFDVNYLHTGMGELLQHLLVRIFRLRRNIKSRT